MIYYKIAYLQYKLNSYYFYQIERNERTSLSDNAS